MTHQLTVALIFEWTRPDQGTVVQSVQQQDRSSSKVELVRCEACNKDIVSDLLRADGHTFHPACFRCCGCQKAVSGSYARQADGQVFCDRCTTDRAPKCAKCKKGIFGEYLTSDSKSYHRQCFACIKCRHPIAGAKHFVVEGGEMCVACHEKAHPKEKCAGCGKVIDGTFTKTDNKAYHPGCFKCSKCRSPIGATYYHEGKNAVCEACQPKCDICKKGMGDQPFVQAEGLRMHKECHRCCDCNKQISGSFFSIPQLSDKKKVHQCTDCRERCKREAAATVKDGRRMEQAPVVVRSDKPSESVLQTRSSPTAKSSKPLIVHIDNQQAVPGGPGGAKGTIITQTGAIMQWRGGSGKGQSVATLWQTVGGCACTCCYPSCSWIWSSKQL